jgi:hypothetical protein
VCVACFVYNADSVSCLSCLNRQEIQVCCSERVKRVPNLRGTSAIVLASCGLLSFAVSLFAAFL